MTQPPPEIHSDDAWKQQAQREKDRLGGGTPAPQPAKEPATQPEPARPRRQLPPPSLELLIEQFSTQALLFMGLIPHPATGKTQQDLDMARHTIDMLGVLQEKTKGNVTPEEERLLTSSLYDLRMTFVKVSTAKP